MNIDLRELQAIIKETISETYFGASSTFGGLDSPAFNDPGNYTKDPDSRCVSSPENPIDQVELTDALLNIFVSISDIPQNCDTCSEPSIMENDIAVVIRSHIGADAGNPVGDFGDVAFNFAAEEAAKVLIDDPEDLEGAAKACARGLLSPNTEYQQMATRMYEGIIAFPRMKK
tara:strand:- start:754 stop:1272 length:519 start_codon:yes stop_codon:yes gene_type:complete